MNQMPDVGPLMPEIYLAGAALLIMVVDLVVKRKETIAVLSFLVTIGVGVSLLAARGVAFEGMYVADAYGAFFKLIFLLTLALSILISIKYIAVERSSFGEYYSLLLFATLGMMLMASAGDLIVLYLGLELMALSTYVLTGFIRHNRKSNEAAIKYFLLGAFSSAMLLYGISLTYGLTGTTDIRGVASYIASAGLATNGALFVAVLLFVVALGYKIALAPFHMWAPDVYEGAPTSITAYLSVGPKAAALAALGRVFLIGFGELHVTWAHVLVPVAVLTMAVGNVLALSQHNIKRMLAYSSIAHAGYALLGLVAGTAAGVAGLMNYMFIYAFMNIGAFAVVILLRREGYNGDYISDYEGLSKTHPLLAALMLVFMFSLTGIPPTAGFMAKFYVFMAAINAGYTWLVVVALIFSVVSAYFYLRIVMYMYMREPQTEVKLSTSPGINVALAVTTAAVIVLGILPSRVSAILDVAKSAAEGFLR
jgi:NADH-quinone oxidoreductase subunit N